MTAATKSILLETLSDALEFCEGLSDGTLDARADEQEANNLVPRIEQAIAIVNAEDAK